VTAGGIDPLVSLLRCTVDGKAWAANALNALTKDATIKKASRRAMKA
jgi:hypothetical protein